MITPRPRGMVNGNTRSVCTDARTFVRQPTRKWSWNPPANHRAIVVSVSRGTGKAVVYSD